MFRGNHAHSADNVVSNHSSVPGTGSQTSMLTTSSRTGASGSRPRGIRDSDDERTRSNDGYVNSMGSIQFGRATVYDTPIGIIAPTKEPRKRMCIRKCREAKNFFLRWAARVLNSTFFSTLMAFLTIFVLVGDDIRLACFDKEKDNFFNWITVISLCLFMLEILFSSLCKEDYFLGFWFLADLFASMSLIFDLTYVSEAMMGYPAISFQNLSDQTEGTSVEETEYARASRSSRVGTRVARLLRVVRLIRLSRIIRALQWFLLTTSRGRLGDDPAGLGRFVGPGESAELAKQAESRVGKKLSERTTQRVILLVLTMLVGVPQLNLGEFTIMVGDSAQYGADIIYQAWQDLEIATARNDTPKALERLRLDWELQTLTYIYYHNWHAACPEGTREGSCAEHFLHKLCWVGSVATDLEGGLDNDSSLSVAQDGYIQALAQRGLPRWDYLFNSETDESYKFIVGSLPEGIKENLAAPWLVDCSESSSRIRGVSLIPGSPCPRLALRKQETIWYTPIVTNRRLFDQHMKQQFVFVFDIRSLLMWEAVLGITQTFFVVVVLAIGALFFSRDVDKLVLLPIERMISKVETIRQDPLYAIQLGNEKMKGETDNLPARSDQLTRRGRLKARRAREEMKKATLETKILENAIIKLGSLLALGFGEAGTEIIGANLDDDNASVNAMIPGSKVEAIYGFCAIRSFATVTEILQEKTSVFVNQIAAIVHRIVDQHAGHPNKNVGEAFLLVWRISSLSAEKRPKTAGLAVLSFVKVVAEVGRDWQLAEYRTHPALLARLPNFRVSLGFGLHLGWSIEGAIGSEFKIDASYLSPHVNMAARLEAATSEYGVTILLSEPLVRSCTAQMSRHFRPIDHVKLQGTKDAIRLFSVDLNHEVLPVESAATARRRSRISRWQEKAENERRKCSIMEESFVDYEVFNLDKHIKRMRERFKLNFFREFEKGYLNYEAGEWDVAAKVLRETQRMLDVEDGPSRTLLEYMGQTDFKAPSSWPGWRELRDR